MTVVAHDPYVTDAPVELVSFAELLARADVVSVHAPLTDETRTLFDAAALTPCAKAWSWSNWPAASSTTMPCSPPLTAERSPLPVSTSPNPNPYPPTTRCCTATGSSSRHTSPRPQAPAGCGCIAMRSTTR